MLCMVLCYVIVSKGPLGDLLNFIHKFEQIIVLNTFPFCVSISNIYAIYKVFTLNTENSSFIVLRDFPQTDL